MICDDVCNGWPAVGGNGVVMMMIAGGDNYFDNFTEKYM
jgi:hypothetical protein